VSLDADRVLQPCAMSEEVATALRTHIVNALPDAEVEVEVGSPGHYSLVVTSAVFEGKSLLAKQRLVYAAITPLMGDDRAVVHAIDRLETKLP